MKTYNFTDNQIQTILDALVKCPYIQVYEIINTIEVQFMEQANPVEITEEIVNEQEDLSL